MAELNRDMAPVRDIDLHNLQACNQVSYVDLIERYADARGLTPCEQFLVERHVHVGSDVLDMGVGTGRTVPALTRRAGRYVGIDYASMMIGRAQERFPGVDLRVLSAADLSDFEDRSFDAVLFVFNGLDSLSSEARLACLAESARVLRPGGVYIISRHNPRGLAATIDPSFVPDGDRNARAAVRNAVANAWRKRRGFASRAFWSGIGQIDEPPFTLLAATPRRVIAETTPLGFSHVETVSCTYPQPSVALTAPWYYYVFRRAAG